MSLNTTERVSLPANRLTAVEHVVAHSSDAGYLSLMDNPRIARWFFGLTSALVTFGILLQLEVAINNDNALFDGAAARTVNVLSYFTVQSNILVALTTGLLAVRLNRTATWFRVLRLSAVIAITITGVVFHLALKGLQELTGKAVTADWILHTASPLLGLVGWLVFGPRGWVNRRIVRLSVAFPVLWLAYTLIRGAIVTDKNGRDFYPYPFLDVVDHGYLRVTLNILLVAALFFALALGGLAADKRLRGIRLG